MKKSIAFWQMAGFLFTGVAGTLLHFLFDWTGENVVAALFSAVNESTWEHMKLLFYPVLVVAVVQYFRWGKDIPSFWCTKLLGTLLGLGLIPALYYTYTGILGTSVDWFNIAIFFLAAAALYYAETKLFLRDLECKLCPRLALGLILALAVFFTIFTFKTPHIPLFKDPLTGTYGFQG